MVRTCRFLIAVYLLGGLLSLANADEKDWDERSFVGNTRYTFELDNGKEIIKGETSGAASVLYRQERVDLSKRPVVRWRWKIKSTYGADINEQSREGDDYPARVYVVVKTGLFPWQTLAVNYVWSSNGKVGDTWPSAYTKKSHMVAVQAGNRNAGLWFHERRNVVEDFKRLFDVDVSTLEGYAVMVDGDNTGSSGTAWFSDIRFDEQ
ncbi:MAG: DUF3047 domain-containing protein [Halopseudomonas sp.]